MPWPEDSVVASVRRGRQVLIPHGETALYAGDVVVVLASEQAGNEIRRLYQI